MKGKDPKEKEEKEEGFIGGSDPIGREFIHISNTDDYEKNEEMIHPRFISGRQRNHETDGA